MGLKLLHSADWHLGTAFSSFREEQRQLLRQAQRRLPGLFAELVRREHCDLVLLSGDLTEGRVSREWAELLQSAFREMGVPVFIAPGNHDFCSPGSLWQSEVWPENVHIFTGGLESVVLPGLDCRVYGAGYRSMDCPPLLENFRAEGQERWCVGVLHGDPLVRHSPCCPVTKAQVRDSGLDYLALGHIHKAGAFTAGSTLCAWPGCPMGRGWDETGEKGAYIVTLEDTAAIQWTALPLPRFYDLQVPSEESPDGYLPPVAGEDFYRVSITGSGAVDLRELEKRFEYLPNLEFRDRTRPEEDLWATAGTDSFRGVYFDLLRRSEDPARELAAKLSRQLLAGEEVPLP